MASSVRRYASYLNSPFRLARCEIIPQQPNKWTLPEEGALQWADEQQHQEEVELDEDGRPLTPPPPLFLSLDDSYRNRDVAAAMNRYFSCSCQAVSRLLRGWGRPHGLTNLQGRSSAIHVSRLSWCFILFCTGYGDRLGAGESIAAGRFTLGVFSGIDRRAICLRSVS